MSQTQGRSSRRLSGKREWQLWQQITGFFQIISMTLSLIPTKLISKTVDVSKYRQLKKLPFLYVISPIPVYLTSILQTFLKALYSFPCLATVFIASFLIKCPRVEGSLVAFSTKYQGSQIYGSTPLTGFLEIWQQTFMWSSISIVAVHCLATIIAFATLRKHKYGRWVHLIKINSFFKVKKI